MSVVSRRTLSERGAQGTGSLLFVFVNLRHQRHRGNDFQDIWIGLSGDSPAGAMRSEICQQSGRGVEETEVSGRNMPQARWWDVAVLGMNGGSRGPRSARVPQALLSLMLSTVRQEHGRRHTATVVMNLNCESLPRGQD